MVLTRNPNLFCHWPAVLCPASHAGGRIAVAMHKRQRESTSSSLADIAEAPVATLDLVANQEVADGSLVETSCTPITSGAKSQDDQVQLVMDVGNDIMVTPVVEPSTAVGEAPADEGIAWAWCVPYCSWHALSKTLLTTINAAWLGTIQKRRQPSQQTPLPWKRTSRRMMQCMQVQRLQPLPLHQHVQQKQLFPKKTTSQQQL